MARHTFSVSRTISDQQLSRIIQIESAGRPAAKAPTSSATGLFQFLDSTWLGVVQKHRPDWFQGRSRSQVLALRLDPASSVEMGARFTEDNARALGPGWQEGDLYLAHFLGLGTARKVMRAEQFKPVEPIAGAAAVRANRSILQGKSCGQVRAWAEQKMRTADDRMAQVGLAPGGWVAKYWPASRRIAEEEEPKPSAADQEENEIARGVEEEAEEEDQPVTYTLAETIAVQTTLKDIGYSEVGMVDGEWGSRSVAAASAFQHDRGLDVTGQMDELLKQELDAAVREGFKRPISEERKHGTPPDSKIVKNSEKGIIATVVATVTGWLTQFGEYVPGVKSIVDSPAVKPFRVLVSDNFGLILFVLGGLALYFFWRNRQDRIRMHREGELS